MVFPAHFFATGSVLAHLGDECCFCLAANGIANSQCKMGDRHLFHLSLAVLSHALSTPYCYALILCAALTFFGALAGPQFPLFPTDTVSIEDLV